jgi:hypothetical protein
MNFQGSCIVATDGGGGLANITVGSKWLIASHSFAYTETMSSNNFWYGDTRCGWDSCSYDVAYDLKGGYYPTIQTQNINCGISNPFYLGIGDKVEVCGTAYCSGATTSNNINVVLSYFICSELNSSTFTLNYLNDSTNAFEDGSKTSCFNLGYTIDGDFNPCDVLFVLGFNVDGLGANTDVKISYTFKASTNCNA